MVEASGNRKEAPLPVLSRGLGCWNWLQTPIMQACNITDRDQLRNHKSRISISRKSRTHILRLLGHFWAGSLMYITGSHGTMAMPHAQMAFQRVKCKGCGALRPLAPIPNGAVMTRMLAGPRHSALTRTDTFEFQSLHCVLHCNV